MSLIDKVVLRIQEEKLIVSGDAVVVAVSGGPDSVALLHVLFLLSERLDCKIIAAHVNHRFRGEESDAEADFVVRLAARLGVACEVGNIDVPAYIDQTSLNAQVAAREKRYQYLHQVAEAYQAKRIALAHHADDQAETLLMRIIRGTGPAGLTGIPERRLEKKVELIRPFLRIYKTELVQYCMEQELTYCQDSSNELRKYFRNQVRLDVIPFLKQYSDQLPEALNRLSEMMQAEDDYMEGETAGVYTEIVTSERSVSRFSREEFARLHVALQRRLIKLILSYLAQQVERFDFARLELIRSAILQDKTSNLHLNVGEHISLIREYDEIRFQSPISTASAYSYQVEPEDSEMIIHEAGVKLIIRISHKGDAFNHVESMPIRVDEAYFDLDQLAFPLFARSRHAGDRMEPLGLNGSKKVKDMFIDAKVPPSLRDATPLLVDAAGRVLWIPGLRRSKHAPVLTGTSRMLHMKLLPY